MKYLEMLRAQRAAIDERHEQLTTELETLATIAIDEKRSLSETEDARVAEIRAALTADEPKIAELDEQIAQFEVVEARAVAAASAPEVQVIRKNDPADVIENRNASHGEIRGALMRSLEDRVDPETAADIEKLLKRHNKTEVDRQWAHNLLARSTEVYERAFAKYVSSPSTPMWDADEQRAIVVGTNTSGGFLLPTMIDPTLILTNNGTDNAIRQMSRVVTLTGDSNALYYPSTAGVTASWDGELVEVSDDSPTIARGSIPIFKGAAFIEASIEATQDLGILMDSLRDLFSDAKDRLEGAAFATGNGTTAPRGIFTALDANTNVELTTTTAGTVGAVDIQTVYRSLGVRWRGNATWLMNPLWNLGIKTLGAQTSDSIGDIRDGTTGRLLGRPVVEAEDAPSVTTTTALDNVLAFGDFRNYVIAQKPGSMAVEYIPHIFGNTNSRPIGARGWYAYWRTGADSVNDLAFRLLQDKTSA